MAEIPNLTLGELKESLEYHPDGYFTWKKCNAKWIKLGAKAGCFRLDGYCVIRLKKKSYLVHRLVYFYHTGIWPKLIDHIDQDHTNNKIENLRSLDKKGNVYNTKKLWKHNTSGVRGVSWDSQQQKWTVRFRHKDKYLFFGYYLNLEDAKQKRLEIERRYLNYG